jgi:hypothetical protein
MAMWTFCPLSPPKETKIRPRATKVELFKITPLLTPNHPFTTCTSHPRIKTHSPSLSFTLTSSWKAKIGNVEISSCQYMRNTKESLYGYFVKFVPLFCCLQKSHLNISLICIFDFFFFWKWEAVE